MSVTYTTYEKVCGGRVMIPMFPCLLKMTSGKDENELDTYSSILPSTFQINSLYHPCLSFIIN